MPPSVSRPILRIRGLAGARTRRPDDRVYSYPAQGVQVHAITATTGPAPARCVPGCRGGRQPVFALGPVRRGQGGCYVRAWRARVAFWRWGPGTCPALGRPAPGDSGRQPSDHRWRTHLAGATLPSGPREHDTRCRPVKRYPHSAKEYPQSAKEYPISVNGCPIKAHQCHESRRYLSPRRIPLSFSGACASASLRCTCIRTGRMHVRSNQT